MKRRPPCLGCATPSVCCRSMHIPPHMRLQVVIGAVVWQDILLLAYAASLKSGLSTSQNIFKVYIFFSDLADSLFIVSIAAV